MIDNAPIYLFRHTHIETAIACFHMKGRYLTPFCRQYRHTTIGVTQHEQRIGIYFAQNTIDCDYYIPYRFSPGRPGGV